MSAKPTLLFITHAESGQANCHLAVISSIKAKYGEKVNIHLASHSPLSKRAPSGVTFHTIVGLSIIQHLERRYNNDWNKLLEFFQSPPGFRGCIKLAKTAFGTVHAETPEEYVDTAQDVERVITETNPDYVVVDMLMCSSRDAIRKLGKEASVLTPNTTKEIAMADQEAGVFSIPAVNSAYPYPLPWYLYPANIIITIFTGIWLLAIDKKHKASNKLRNKNGYPGMFPLFDKVKENSVLCMTHPGADIPMVIPDWLKCCGPIIQASERFEDVDPDLYKWCQQKPTILINLGTIKKSSKRNGQEILKSIRTILSIRPDVQVLWKLSKLGEYTLEGSEEAGDRLKIVDWLKADPFAMLRSGNIICSIHHGGSNSYHEALYAGIPQVVLPGWTDCYDFAARLRYLGIGEWGNPKSAPDCSEPEFTKAVLKVIGRTNDDSVALTIRKRAQEVGRIVTENYTQEGRDIAADHIWEQMQQAIAKKA
ncbi:uncharacterized protein L201_000463 [Kwoniella dendrophila CBS 6074]|uniref:Erythromycin biosynthesis protein CIII-like C-terminal domain-containing protein n=1 Tax=Kwoniella dendrophila CBS 6074 TaxID=1295534 RepID=A0AAX4JLE8_9TREE